MLQCLTCIAFCSISAPPLPPTPTPTGTYAGVLARAVVVQCNAQRKLFDKLIHMGVEKSLCVWVLDFLQDKSQSNLAGEPPRRSPSTSVPPLPPPPPAGGRGGCALASAVVIVHSVSSDPSAVSYTHLTLPTRRTV